MPELKIVNVKPIRRDVDGDAFPQIKEVSLTNMVQNPIDLFQRFFKGSPQEYKALLERNNVTWDDFQKITVNPTLFNAELNNFVMRLHKAIKDSEYCDPALKNYPTGRLNKSMANLESVVYDFSSFDQTEYDVISQNVAMNYKSPAMIAILDYDYEKRTITTYTSYRGLYIDPYTQALNTSIGNRDKGEVSPSLDGTPSVDTGLERKNWVMLEQIKLFIEIAKSQFGDAYSLAFKTPKHHKTYFESDVLNAEPNENELFVRQLAEQSQAIVKDEIPRGSLSPNTSEKVIEKIQSEINPQTQEDILLANTEPSEENEEVDELHEAIDRLIEHAKEEEAVKENNAIPQIEISEHEKAVAHLEDEVLFKTEAERKAHFMAKRSQIDEAEKNIARAVEVFKEAMLKGTDLLKSFDMVDQTFKNNPYIREALSKEIKNEFLGVIAKDKIIFGLREAIAVKNLKVEEWQGVVTVRDNEIATLVKDLRQKDEKYNALVLDREKDFEKFEEAMNKLNEEKSTLQSEKAQLEDDLETAILSVDQYKGQVETLKTQVSTLSDEIIKYKSLVPQLQSQKEILEATVKSKEELLKTQVSRNELLEKSNDDLKAQLEALKALNVAKEDEKVKLQEELKISREMLKEAQKAQEQAKENERLEAGKTKNIKRAEYTKPLDKKEIQKDLDNAPDGSASSSRLRLVLDGKIDFSKIQADTPEAMQIIDNAKADFEALEEKGLLTCNRGVYAFKDDQAKSVVYNMNGASVQEIADEYASIQYNKPKDDESAKSGSYTKPTSSYGRRSGNRSRG